jgi:GntR family transcriptional regulator/MocR family aminotransferase
MFTFYIDRKSKVPIYVQLYQFIRSQIENGLMEANEKLPSKRKLSNHLKISQITVDSAYQQLVVEGYIKSVAKSGFYVEEYGNHDFINNYKHEEPIISKIKEVYIIDFKTNVVDTNLFPNKTWAKLAREVLSENSYEMVNVTNPQGLYELREEIAKYLQEYRGINVHPDQIILGAGSDLLIGLIIQLIGRTSVYAIENPGYSKVYQIFKYYDVTTIPIGLDEYGLKVSELEETKANLVQVTPSHQFPTGSIMPIRRRLELLNWANKDPNHYILEDDYDSEFRFYGQPIPALQGLDNNKVIYLNTFTKTIAPSLRISYLVLPINLLNKYIINQTYYSCSIPNFDQYILYKFMQGGYFERHINRMRNTYKERLESLIDTLNKSSLADIVKVYGHDAGLHFMLQVNNNMTETEIVNAAKGVGIKVYGLSGYYHLDNSSIPKSTIVIGYSSLTITEIQTAINLLEKVWVNNTYVV